MGVTRVAYVSTNACEGHHDNNLLTNCNKNQCYYLKQHLTTFMALAAVNLLCVKLFRIRGAGFIKAIIRADK
jgi:hypothetical protein